MAPAASKAAPSTAFSAPPKTPSCAPSPFPITVFGMKRYCLKSCRCTGEIHETRASAARGDKECFWGKSMKSALQIEVKSRNAARMQYFFFVILLLLPLFASAVHAANSSSVLLVNLHYDRGEIT